MPTNVRNGWQPGMGPTASSSPLTRVPEPKLKNPAIHSSYCPKTSKLVPKHHPRPLRSTLAPNTNRQQPIPTPRHPLRPCSSLTPHRAQRLSTAKKPRILLLIHRLLPLSLPPTRNPAFKTPKYWNHGLFSIPRHPLGPSSSSPT